MRKILFFLIISTTPVISLSQVLLETKGFLADDVNRTSGLLFYDGKLISHNDSGDTPQLFEIDTVSLEATRTITLQNVPNIDWEDIDQDTEYIYVGDFGNYNGTRENLAVYRVSKNEFRTSNNVQAQRINFKYEDQTSFIDNGFSDFDAEAMFILEDEIVILTKQWLGNATVAYSIPKIPGTYDAERLDSFDVGGLITGATYNPTLKVLYLSGYSQILEPFLVRVEAPRTDLIFGGRKEKIDVNIDFAQVEGITLIRENRYFLSSESFNNIDPPINLNATLFAFNTNDQQPLPEQETGESVLIYRGSNSNFLEYELQNDIEVTARAIYDTSGKQLLYATSDKIETNSVDLSTLQKSVYYLTFYFRGGLISKPFIWN